ncbi:hypothetical protein JZ751_015809 [Albula glossodonta]|uniref:Uncharacterized protein n=1 Tax=Albula glossodonta TaxID=121402 RepID=A0A8T2MVJ0_9TELE|nr:hypothetical protein JZ751_015809 [Albula glossodonta]
MENLQTLWPSRTGVKPADTVALQDWRLELNLQTLWPSKTGVKPADTVDLQDWRLELNLQTLWPSRTGVKPADTAALQDWRLELNLQTLRPPRTGVKPADTAALQDWRLESNPQTLRPPRTGVKPADTAALQDWRLELNLQTLRPSRTGVKPAVETHFHGPMPSGDTPTWSCSLLIPEPYSVLMLRECYCVSAWHCISAAGVTELGQCAKHSFYMDTRYAAPAHRLSSLLLHTGISSRVRFRVSVFKQTLLTWFGLGLAAKVLDWEMTMGMVVQSRRTP